jgi:RHS repeat-associated protein
MEKIGGVRRPKTLAALLLAFALSPRLFAQTFPAGNWKDFSDGMIETPDTSMSIEPDDPIFSTQEPSGDETVVPDASYTPPPEPYSSELPETASNYEGPVGVTGIFNGNVTTACSYDPLSHSAHRVVDDIVVPGSVGKYPLKMTRYYNSRQQYYAAPGAIGLSPGWSHEYAWLLWAAGHKVVSPHGNVSDDYCGQPVGISEWWDPAPSPTPPPGGRVWRLADGGRITFDANNRVTDIYDPYGQRTRIAYYTSGSQIGQRAKVTEPGGRCLWFIYGTQNQGNGWGDGTWLVTRVEAYDSDGSPGSPAHPNGQLIDWVNYTYQAYDPLDPQHPGERRQKMLTGVAYSDGTSASYEYRTDNVTENQTTHKMYPLLQKAVDVRYDGPMRTVWYDYQNHYPHGFIWDEKSPGTGAVSTISANGPDTFTETRGDGPTRTFTYTHMNHCTGNPECTICDDYENNEAWPYRAPQQMLKSYTDFKGNTTQIDYDSHWYINSVTDANNHTTSYTRGPAPPAGIGEIKIIVPPGGSYPDGAYIEYTYEDLGHYITSVRDENGHVTTLHRDANHRISQIDYPTDANTSASYEGFIYNGFGQVTYHLLRNGAWERFDYDSRGLLTDKWNPQTWAPGGNDPYTHYEYYTSGPWIDRVKKMTGPAPNYENSVQTWEVYEYDRKSDGTPCAGRGLVTKITCADNSSKSFAYDQWGNKVSEWNELGERTDYVYDGYNRVTSSTKIMAPSANELTSYTYNPTNGGGGSSYLHTTNNPNTVTAPTGIMTSNVYDENFRKTQTSVAGRTTWFHYDPVGNLQCVTDPRGSGECPSPNTQCAYTTRTEYDTRNRKWHVWDAQNHLTTFTYDNASNVRYIDRPDTLREEKTYDAVNRVLSHMVPKDGDSSHNITTRFYYNPSGTLQSVKDGENRQTTFAYDASDRRITMTYPNTSQFQSWAYDDAHHMKSRTTVNGKTEYFAYDNRNRKSGRAWENLSGEWAIYVFDAAGQLGRAVNGGWQGQTPTITADVHRGYDHAGRLTLDKQDIDGENNGLGPLEVHYEYNPGWRGTDGKPTLMYVNNLGEGYDYDFRYDEMGRFEKIFLHSAGNPWFQYHYDNASNETQRDNLLNHVNQIYNPDSLNRPTLVELQHDGTSFARESYDYWPMGWLKTITRPNNTQDQFFYYYDGELFAVMYGVEGVSAPDPQEMPPADDPSKEKTVDDFLSLSGWDPNTALTADRTVQYAYDKAGNRNTVDDSLIGSTTYTPNTINQYSAVQACTVSNGPEHEISSFQGPTDAQPVNYQYMKDEHLIRVASGNSTYDLAYDALGRCVKRTLVTASTTGPGSSPRPRPTPHPRPSVPPPSPTPSASPSPTPPGQLKVTKYYIYDGERPILEYDANGELAGYNLYGKGVDEILLRFDPWLPQTFYYQQDHEDSITHLTYNPPTGVSPILEYYRYDAFGKATIYGPPPNWSLRQTSLYSNRFLFTGREYNAMFGFYEYRARAYHPGLGRFMSEDPKLFVRRAGLGKAPDDWSIGAHPDEAEFNLFRYCGNDPIDFTDPMGLEVGFGESLIPVWGSGHMAYDAYNQGHYGWAAFHTAMAVSDLFPTKAGLTALGKAGVKAFARKEIAAVIGKYPNYLKVAEEVGAKRFNIPTQVWARMSEAERWAANQKFLDRAIARGGDIVLDKPIKDISAVSGDLRKELNYLTQQGYRLSEDGSKMVKAQESASNLIHSKPDPSSP